MRRLCYEHVDEPNERITHNALSALVYLRPHAFGGSEQKRYVWMEVSLDIDHVPRVV